MLNDAHVAITGYVVSQPKFKRLPSGIPVLTMRIGWTPRHLDRSTSEWVDGNTSYATVIAWRRLAIHGSLCLRKGDPVSVTGRLSVRDFEVDGVRRNSVEVEAGSIGHDLNRGVTSFSRFRSQSGQTAAEYAEAMVAKAAGVGQADQVDPAKPESDPSRFGPPAGATGAEMDDGDDLADFVGTDAGPVITADDGEEEDDLDQVAEQASVPF